MSSFKNYWKVWLRLNLLTGETDNATGAADAECENADCPPESTPCGW